MHQNKDNQICVILIKKQNHAPQQKIKNRALKPGFLFEIAKISMLTQRDGFSRKLLRHDLILLVSLHRKKR